MHVVINIVFFFFYGFITAKTVLFVWFVVYLCLYIQSKNKFSFNYVQKTGKKIVDIAHCTAFTIRIHPLIKTENTKKKWIMFVFVFASQFWRLKYHQSKVNANNKQSSTFSSLSYSFIISKPKTKKKQKKKQKNKKNEDENEEKYQTDAYGMREQWP